MPARIVAVQDNGDGTLTVQVELTVLASELTEIKQGKKHAKSLAGRKAAIKKALKAL
jgi:hypothetical protein